jgi:hypothetical protein
VSEALEEAHHKAGFCMNACDDYDGMGRDAVLGFSFARQVFNLLSETLKQHGWKKEDESK